MPVPQQRKPKSGWHAPGTPCTSAKLFLTVSNASHWVLDNSPVPLTSFSRGESRAERDYIGKKKNCFLNKVSAECDNGQLLPCKRLRGVWLQTSTIRLLPQQTSTAKHLYHQAQKLGNLLPWLHLERLFWSIQLSKRSVYTLNWHPLLLSCFLYFNITISYARLVKDILKLYGMLFLNLLDYIQKLNLFLKVALSF